MSTSLDSVSFRLWHSQRNPKGYSMLRRIRDAYRVLTGEYVAQPRVQVPSMWWVDANTTTTYTTPPADWVKPRAGSVDR